MAVVENADASIGVAWHHPTSPGTESLLDTTVTNGKVGATSTIAADWASLANPALARAGTGDLRAFFGGLHSTDTEDPNNDLNMAVSTDG